MNNSHCLLPLALWAAAMTFLPATAFSSDGSKTPASVHDFTVKDMRGKDVKLSRFKGKVLLIVNVASRCGLTPQYAGLQALYEKYRKSGFVILAFPANDFNNQEPGSNAEIEQFCKTKYGVTFPVFAKISVKGEAMHPLYRYLTSKETNPEHSGEIEWNFAKFVIGRDGRIAARFAPQVRPEDPAVARAIEGLLEQKR